MSALAVGLGLVGAWLTTASPSAAAPTRIAAMQDPAAVQKPPVVDVTGPTVIAFWRVPRSDAELEEDVPLAMGLDQQQYYWAESVDSLQAIGVRPVSQAGLSFILRRGAAKRTFSAHPDSSDIGYVLVAPDRPMRVLYTLRYPDELVAEARAYFEAQERAGPDAREWAAEWLPLHSYAGLARLENENRVSELCSDVEPGTLGACYERVLAPSIEFHPLHVAPDSTSDRVGELVVVATPGRGLNAYFRAAGSNDPVPFTPDLYLPDWGYGPYFHQTITARRDAWFQLPRRPWPDPVWVHRPDQRDSSSLASPYQGMILEMRGEGWVVLDILPDALMMRPEQEADMWCHPEEPPPLVPTEPTRFTRDELVDEDGHLVIRPKYMKGC